MFGDYLSNTSYDSIILGTGFTESIVAAALSRVGEKIIHLDANDFYGDINGSLMLDQFNDILKKTQHRSNISTESESDDSKNSSDSSNSNIISNTINNLEFIKQPLPLLPHEHSIPFEFDFPIQLNTSLSYSENDQYVLQCKKDRKLRLFSIDLISKIIFASGEIVQLLIDSGIGRYTEFKGVDAILIFMNNKWNNVPCSKGEIFKSKLISLKDKRYLTKFMKTCLEEDLILNEEERNMNFIEYLRNKHKLSEDIIQLICYSIVLLSSMNENISTKEGMKRVRMYLKSIGRYGTTSFLYPVYGVCELPQAFCRVGAIFGGTYILRRSVQNLYADQKNNQPNNKDSLNDNQSNPLDVTSIQCSLGQRINAKNIIHSPSYKTTNEKRKSSIVRCLSVTTTPILDPYHYKNHSNPRQMYHPHNGILMMIVPPFSFGEDQTHSISIIQLDSTSNVCPANTYLISFQSKCINYDILKKCVDYFLNTKSSDLVDSDQIENSNPNNETVENFDSNKPNETTISNELEMQLKEEAQSNQNEPTQPNQNQEAQSKQEETSKSKKLLYQVYYSLLESVESQKLSHLHPTNPYFDTIHLEESVLEAKQIFETIHPGKPFLKDIPNPDETIYDENAKLLGVDQEIDNITEF